MPFTVEGLAEIEKKPGPFAFEKEVELHKNFLIMNGWSVSPVSGLVNEEREIQACPIAVLPTAIYRNANTGREKIELKYWKFGRWNRILVDRDTIANVNKIISLSNFGLEVTGRNSKVLMNALNEIIQNSLHKMRYFTSVSALGWFEDEFVPFSGTVVLDSESEYGALFDCMDSCGTLDEWKSYMAPLLKNLPLRLTVAASFASPIIEIVGQLPFIIHLWGKTESGKTVAAMCAASVWGNPSKGKFLKSLNSTPFAMLTMAAVLKNLPLVADELQTIRCSSSDFDKLIMTLTEGVNRARMNRSRMEQTLSWNNCFVLNGEQPITTSGSGAGAVNRCIQIEVGEKLMPDGGETANFLTEHYGTAGREFINRLDPNYVRDVYGSVREMLETSAKRSGFDCTSKQLGAMALLLTGDELMREFFFEDSLEFLTPDMVLPYLASAKQVDISERAYDFIVNVLSANSQAFTEKSKESWGKFGPGRTIYVNNSILERELRQGGFEFAAVKRSWANKGYLLRNEKDSRLRHVVNIWGVNTSCSLISLPDSDEDNQNNRTED